MRIFSEFNDYYDHIGFYAKEDRVWERHTKTFDLNTELYKDRIHTGLTIDTEETLVKLLKTLPTISTAHKVYKYSNRHSDFVTFFGFCGTLQIFIIHDSGPAFIAFTDFNEYVEYFTTKRPNEKLIIDKDNYFWGKPFNKKYLNDLRNQFCNKGQFEQVFVELNTPIFLLRDKRLGYYTSKGYDNHLIVNPNLQEYKIQSIIHPYQAHQEIDMYLNNVLTVRENPDIKRSDELIRDSKGMDKFSFRQTCAKPRKLKKK